MYKVELKQAYTALEFEFECFNDAAYFIQTALNCGDGINAKISIEEVEEKE